MDANEESTAAAASETDGGDWARVQEVLSAVPLRLGHHPAPGSVVAVGLADGTDARPLLVARTTIEVLGGVLGERVARSIAGHLRGMGCRHVLAVSYALTSADVAAREAVELLHGGCAAAGLHWEGTWTVGSRWVRGGPDSGRFPIDELAQTRTATAARTAGIAPAVRREDLGHIPSASHVDRRACAEGRLRWAQKRPVEDGPVWGDWQRRSLLRWEKGLRDPEGIQRAALGRIEAALDDPLVLEAAALLALEGGSSVDREEELIARLTMAAITPPSGPVTEGWEHTAPQLRPWLVLLLAPGIDPPDPARTDATVRLLRRVVAHGRRTRQSGALALLGLLCWWQGDGVRGAVFVERALGHRPTQPLAAQLDWLLAAGAVPGWARGVPVTRAALGRAEVVTG